MYADILLESMNIDPIGDMFNDPQFCITESTNEVDEYIREAAEGATKKNIFQRLKDLIMKCFRAIADKCRQIGTFWKNLFSKKEVCDKTLDQIAKSCFGETDEEPSKHLNFEYLDGTKIKFNYLANAAKRHVKATKVPGHDLNDRKIQEGILMIFKIINKPNIVDSLINQIEGIQSNSNTYNFSPREIKKACKQFWVATSVSSLSCTISLEQFTQLTEKVTRLHKALQILDDHTMGTTTVHTEKNTPESNRDLIEALNSVSDIAIILQLGLNYIGDGMRQVYVLDKSYNNKINAKNFKTKLPQFVKTCIESNLPTKYIHQAILDVCDASINCIPGKPTEKKTSATLKGNGRFVLIPGDKSLSDKVIKIAYNNFGVRGNRNEFSIWNKVKDIPEIANELYHIYDIGDKDNLCILCDRVSPFDNYKETDKWNEQMRKYCMDNKIGFIIRCNSGGFGKNDKGKVICADYGTVKRIAN